MQEKPNYYGSLCTEMYELLHPAAPQEELDFYLSYAAPGQRILEALCGSGRFLVPFWERGLEIEGVDLSAEMLAKLREKAPDAAVYCQDLRTFAPGKVYDYIFVTSGSISLFTDPALCREVLQRLKELLAPGGVLVFAVDVLASRCPEDADYALTARAQTPEGFALLLKSKNHYDPRTQTQFMPGLYQLYDGPTLLLQEQMDFQTHLYRFGEMEQLLASLGFGSVSTYTDFSKNIAAGDSGEMFLFECRL